MAFDTMQKFRDAMALAHVIQIEKAFGGTIGGANRTATTWRGAAHPVAGLAPPAPSGRVLDKTSQGAVPLPDVPAGKKLVIGRGELVGVLSTSGTLLVYDRLVECAGIVATQTALQTLNTIALPERAGGGEGVELWVEVVTTVTSAAAAVVTITYTNSDGVGGRVATFTNPTGTSQAGFQSGRPALQAGDTGVRSVESVDFSVAAGTAGEYAIVLRKRICDIGLLQNRMDPRDLDWLGVGMPNVPNDAAMEFLILNSFNAAPGVYGTMHLLEVDDTP